MKFLNKFIKITDMSGIIIISTISGLALGGYLIIREIKREIKRSLS